MRRTLATVALVLVSTACATVEDPESAKADRTIVVTMKDNHFEPDEFDVKPGESIGFRFVNRGSSRHDAFFGDADEQAEHEEEMRKADDDGEHGGHMSGDDDAVILEPGKSATVVKTFSQGGEMLIGCHEPGHYADGMVAEIKIG